MDTCFFLDEMITMACVKTMTLQEIDEVLAVIKIRGPQALIRGLLHDIKSGSSQVTLSMMMMVMISLFIYRLIKSY